MDLSILPECYVDTNLIETLVPPRKRGHQLGYNHQKGCGTVASRMIKNFNDQFALGIIDKDKHQVDYLKEFDELINLKTLILHKHKTKHHYIIQINPAIERFILDNANLVGVSVAEYDLPTNFDLFKQASKKENSKYDLRFKNLFKALIKNNAPDFMKLAGWIKYLKETNYKADIEDLKKI